MATKKSVKKEIEKTPKTITKKVNKRVNTLKETIVSTSTEVLQDVFEKGKAVGTTALEIGKKRVEAIDVEAGVKKVKSTVTNINEFALESADTMVEAGFENTKKWQGIGEKAIKGSLEIAEKQQDIVFENLEVLKGQLTSSAQRIKILFSNN